MSEDYEKRLREIVAELDPDLALRWEAELARQPQAPVDVVTKAAAPPRSPRRRPQAASKAAPTVAPGAAAPADPALARLLAEATAAAAAERGRADDGAGSQ